MSAGTPVGLDARGALVPAGIPGGHTFTYTALDYTVGRVATISAATGSAVAAAGDAIMHSGLTAFKTGEFINPVGVLSTDVYQFEGGVSFSSWPNYTLSYDNPVNYATHNTMAQDLVAITCDYVLLVPYVSGRNLQAANVKIFNNTADVVPALSSDAKSYTFAHDYIVPNTALTVSGSLTNLEVVYISPDAGQGTDGFNSTTAVGHVLTSGATVTYTAPGDSAGTAVNATTVLSTKGDHILYSADTSKYIVLRNRTGGAASVNTANYTFQVKASSPIVPGDFVKARIGKFVKWDPLVDLPEEIIGQVLRVDNNVVGKSYLDKVKTAFERAKDAASMMAGSATRGVPGGLHLVTDGAWRQYSTRKTLAGATIADAGITVPPLALVTINLLK
jgi:hypothetical protein